MLRLEDIKKNAAITGVEPGQLVRVVTTEPVGGNALTIYYKTADGWLLERKLFRTDKPNLSLAEAGRPWAFDAPRTDFKLAAESHLINLDYLFDPMMPVHTSNVEPLPHKNRYICLIPTTELIRMVRNGIRGLEEVFSVLQPMPGKDGKL